MSTHYQTGSFTACGAAGVATAMTAVTITKKAKRIVGLGFATADNDITTLEGKGGVLELSSPDVDLAPMQLPLSSRGAVTSGAVGEEAKIYPVNIPISGGEEIRGDLTMVETLTGTPKYAIIVVTE